jgi:beta-glucosidase
VTADPSWQGLLPTQPIEFPDDFAWGVAASAYQAEGGSPPNDWEDAVRAGRFPPNPGNGFLEHAEGDFVRVAELGLRHYRLSVEWSRVEPERGRFDAAAIDRYKALCDAAREAGLTPWVNFFHFTQPSWRTARGGLSGSEGQDDFLRYVERMTRALHGHARHFHSQNESMVWVLLSYLLGERPPFVADGARAQAMTRAVLSLHARSHQVIKTIDPDHRVVTIEVYLDCHPEDRDDAANVGSVEAFDRWYNGSLLEGLAHGTLTLPGKEPEEIPGLKGAADEYGLNYYSAVRIGRSGVSSHAERADAPVDAMGRRVHPAGLTRGLRRVAAALPGVPLRVTENGCPTEDETFRIRYLAAHLAAVDRARRAGVDVRGYFHWTAVDNYEWDRGFSSARFGLLGFDPVTLARHEKRSALWLRDRIAEARIDPASIP